MRVKNTAHSGVFLTNFEVFGKCVHWLKSLTKFQSELKLRRNGERKPLKYMVSKIRYPNNATVMISSVYM